MIERCKKVALIGGDSRTLAAASEFAADSYECALYAFDNTDIPYFATKAATPASATYGADIIILPIPYSKNGKDIYAPFASSPVSADFYKELDLNGKSIFCGWLDRSHREDLENMGAKVFDLNDYEPFTVINARSTAEAAVGLALLKSERLICGSNIAILGFGRIGRQIAPIVKSLGANVWIFARNTVDFAWIYALGYRPCDYNSKTAIDRSAQIIINTVPADLSECIARLAAPSSLLIDLAGVYKENIGSSTLEKAPALPGKYRSCSSGKLIHDCIKTLIEPQ